MAQPPCTLEGMFHNWAKMMSWCEGSEGRGRCRRGEGEGTQEGKGVYGSQALLPLVTALIETYMSR